MTFNFIKNHKPFLFASLVLFLGLIFGFFVGSLYANYRLVTALEQGFAFVIEPDDPPPFPPPSNIGPSTSVTSSTLPVGGSDPIGGGAVLSPLQVCLALKHVELKACVLSCFTKWWPNLSEGFVCMYVPPKGCFPVWKNAVVQCHKQYCTDPSCPSRR